MKIKKIIEDQYPEENLFSLMKELHEEGPKDSKILEIFTYYKIFHPKTFESYEEKIISALGLFYKIKEPTTVFSYILSGIGEQHKKDFGAYLTPVQASIRRAIESKQIISISAPTSAGKSYSIRDFIFEQEGDAVVIVPSRALIAEYITTMRKKFKNDKNVIITSFVDNIFLIRQLRRIFVLTPERARELFNREFELNIKVFFLDEAQVSEEDSRGIVFDVLVRRIKKVFNASKIIFAHPFVKNPEAQIIKHKFPIEEGYSRSYTFGSVGKVCIFKHNNGKDYYFSPYIDKGYTISNCIPYEGNFCDFAFNGNHSVLIFVSKSSIYNKSFIKDFEVYIKDFIEIDNPSALKIIASIEHLLGADEDEHDSYLVNLLKKGVVLHHGSVPLEVRFLIENFIREGHAKICFSTSTLAQGVNMPFDIVWLISNRHIGESEQEKSLAFKNLIGRAGRLSEDSKFDFGYVFTNNPKLFTRRINELFELKEESIIDLPIDDIDKDSKELIESIKNNTFDEDKNLPTSAVERLSQLNVFLALRSILNILYRDDNSIKDNISGNKNESNREVIYTEFKIIYETSINRKLSLGENAVFKQSISILLQVMQGRTFREIVGTRYSYVSNRDNKNEGLAKFSQEAVSLPKSTLKKPYSIYKEDVLAKSVSYDTIVFDTYDYLDKVLSFSLTDKFIAAFKIYEEESKDVRAKKIIELFRFGTNNQRHILLMRYGFSSEDVGEINKYVISIDENSINFDDNVKNASEHIKNLVEWYL